MFLLAFSSESNGSWIFIDTSDMLIFKLITANMDTDVFYEEHRASASVKMICSLHDRRPPLLKTDVMQRKCFFNKSPHRVMTRLDPGKQGSPYGGL